MNKTCKIEDFKFQHKLNTRWKDLDAFRHINNAVFLSYIEDARIVLLKSTSQLWQKHLTGITHSKTCACQ